MNKGMSETRKDAVKMIESIERRRKVITNVGREVDIIPLIHLHLLIHVGASDV